MLFWYPLFTSCECKADSRSVAAVCLTALAFWVTDSSVALLLSLSCSLRERERERKTGQRIQQHWLLCSECFGHWTKTLQDWTCSKGHCFPITDETVRLSLQRLSGFLSHTLEDIFCTLHIEILILFFYISLLFCNKKQEYFRALCQTRTFRL